MYDNDPCEHKRRRGALFVPAMPSPQGKRFRPSVAALASVRQYKRPTPQVAFASRVADAADAGSSSGAISAGRRRGGTAVMSGARSRGGRFIMRITGGGKPTRTCEEALLHIVNVFAIEVAAEAKKAAESRTCLLYTSPSPRDRQKSRMPSSA